MGPFGKIKENKFPYYRLSYNWDLPLVLSKDSRPLIRLLGISPYTRLRIERMRTTQNAEKQNAVLGTFPAISFIAIVAHGDTALCEGGSSVTQPGPSVQSFGQRHVRD